ncbi:unnamed protein product [Phytophthora lilii]|uniref:Unnamed protein product n=1 Tax=Phytophthora lilii TaxID=2077276 RepID=A0A9W6WQE6_9STRA|nr:unnamed protein product [Phytophthora lilii]
MLLPPTSQVVYDRDRFAAVMRSNLNTVAYVGLLSGVFVLSEAGMSLTLMRHASSWKHRLARAKRSIKDLQQTAVSLDPINGNANILAPDSPLSFFHQVAIDLCKTDYDNVVLTICACCSGLQWIQLFENSTRRQRIAMRVVVVLTILAVAFILAIMCANVVFVAKCSSIGSRIASANFALVNTSTEVSIDTIQLQNSFSRGEIIISAASSSTGSVDIGFYGSERVAIGVELPQDPLRSLIVNSNTSVVVNGSSTDAITFQGLSISTVQSSIVCSNVNIQGDELVLQTTSGGISIEGMVIDARDTSVTESPAKVYSALGLVSLTDVILSHCDLLVETGASSLVLSDIHG